MSGMTGHLRLRNGNWQVVLYECVSPVTGKKRYSYRTVGTSKRQAQAVLNELLAAKQKRKYVKPDKQTVGEYLDRWLKERKRPLGGRTLQEYQRKIERYIRPTMGSTPVQQLEPLDIQELYTKLLETGREGGGELSAQTVLHVHRILSVALKQAVKWKVIVDNPCSGVEAPSVRRKKQKTYTAEQVKHLLAAAKGTSLYPALVIALTTGARRGEVIAMQWSDVDFDRRLLTIQRAAEHTKEKGLLLKSTKSDRERHVSMPDLLVTTLLQHRDEQNELRKLLGPAYHHGGLIWPNEDGSLRTPDSFTRAFQRLLKRSGLPHIRLHDCRHTHATLLLEAKEDMHTVSERLGHSDVRLTLNTYPHVTKRMQDTTAQKIDEMFG